MANITTREETTIMYLLRETYITPGEVLPKKTQKQKTIQGESNQNLTKALVLTTNLTEKTCFRIHRDSISKTQIKGNSLGQITWMSSSIKHL